MNQFCGFERRILYKINEMYITLFIAKRNSNLENSVLVYKFLNVIDVEHKTF